MNQFSLLTFTVFICSLAQAQIKKGDLVLGGNLDYNNQKQTINYSGRDSSIYKYRTISIAPSFGKVIRDNLVLGFSIAYTYYRQDDNQGDVTRGNGFAGSVFLRKYKPLGNGFYLFGEASLGGNYTHTSLNQPGSNSLLSQVTNDYGVTLNLFPGIAYAINPKWQLEMALTNFFVISYSHSKLTQSNPNQPDYHNTIDDFTAESAITGGDTFTIGLRYFIGN